MDQVSVGVWDWNIKNGETCFYPEWSRMLGYDEKLAANIGARRELAPGDDLAKGDKAIAAYLAGGTTDYECVCRIKTKLDGYE
ncbi:MAG: hypothetical protein ACU84Q_14320 [Gammaproteobacteria bacterium]